MQENLRNVIHKFKLTEPNSKTLEVKLSVIGWEFEKVISAKAIGDDIYIWAIMRKILDYQRGDITLMVIPTGLRRFDMRFLDFVSTVWFDNGTNEIYHIFVRE